MTKIKKVINLLSITFCHHCCSVAKLSALLAQLLSLLIVFSVRNFKKKKIIIFHLLCVTRRVNYKSFHILAVGHIFVAQQIVTKLTYICITTLFHIFNIFRRQSRMTMNFPSWIIPSVWIAVKHLYEKRKSQWRNTQQTHPIYLHSSSKYWNPWCEHVGPPSPPSLLWQM